MDAFCVPWADFPLPVLGFGTRALGGSSEWSGPTGEEARRLLQRAYEGGIRFFDTAPSYGEGRAESLLGEWAHEVGRENLLIGTKVGLRRTSEGHYFSDLRPDSIYREVERSLRRLNVEAVDLVQIHWPDPRTPLAESLAALQTLKDDGKTKAIGLGNFHGKRLREALASSAVMDSLQVPFHPLDRRIEGGDLPLCRERNLPVITYSPLAMGLFSETEPEELCQSPGHARHHLRWFGEAVRPAVQNLRSRWRSYAEDLGLTLSQLTIAWVRQHPGISMVLLGASRESQLRENLGGGLPIPKPVWRVLRKDLNQWQQETKQENRAKRGI
ncbi:MAG: aldo/keto reductase [Opitutales bacterium]|nr:aldo/keto reductase [Opitutales bacterium]MCH8541273.1 aldo/keto reductase [Opitutales bacterium]